MSSTHALTFVEKESQTIGGFGRNDRCEYAQRFAETGEIRNRVFVEAGTASGREPTERVRLQSYVGQFLEESGAILGAEDEGTFEMRLPVQRSPTTSTPNAAPSVSVHSQVGMRYRPGWRASAPCSGRLLGAGPE